MDGNDRNLMDFDHPIFPTFAGIIINIVLMELPFDTLKHGKTWDNSPYCKSPFLQGKHGTTHHFYGNWDIEQQELVNFVGSSTTCGLNHRKNQILRLRETAKLSGHNKQAVSNNSEEIEATTGRQSGHGIFSAGCVTLYCVT